MRILVTGGAGFIGSNFIKFWLAEHPQDKIVNLDKLTYAGNLKSLTEIEGNPNYHFVKGDICDPLLVDNLASDVDWIVHFAAESHVDRSLDDPGAFIRTNIEGTYFLLEAALRHKVKRFHFISTDEVFGALPLGSADKFDENRRYDPRSPYSASKAASDHFVMSFYYSFGLPVTITNCSNNYGPYQHPEKFIPRMITNLIAGEKIPIYGDGKYVRDWLYVEDHCRAIEAVLLRGRIGETYCVGGLSKDVSNLELAKMILKLMDKGEDYLSFVPDRPGHDRRYAVDWRKIKQELGWTPEHDLEGGLRETIDWYKKNQPWWQPLKKEAEEFYRKLARAKRLRNSLRDKRGRSK
jgi:dTDP-glucose 4,6-dehydratase